jgi:hypothetical protein
MRRFDVLPSHRTSRKTKGMSHCGLAIYFKKRKVILRQKKNYGNSNISPRKNIIFQKIL